MVEMSSIYWRWRMLADAVLMQTPSDDFEALLWRLADVGVVWPMFANVWAHVFANAGASPSLRALLNGNRSLVKEYRWEPCTVNEHSAHTLGLAKEQFWVRLKRSAT